MSISSRSLGDVGARHDVEPRAARSLRALTDALLQLLSREALDAVSVTELCKVANVHRSTFYSHYASVSELAADVFSRIIDDISTVNGDHKQNLGEPYARSLVHVLAHVAEERLVYRALFATHIGAEFRSQLTGRLNARADLALATFEHEGIAIGSDRALVSAFVAGSVVEAIRVWALSERTDAEAMAAEIIALLPPWWPRRS